MSGVTLVIPGPWQDHTAFIKAIALTDSGVLAAGAMMLAAAQEYRAAFELLPSDANLVREMFIGSGRALDDATQKAIEDHKSVAAITILDTGEGLHDRLAVFTRALRLASGIAVKVHYSGLSHGWARWEENLAAEMPAGLFRLLVVQVPDRDAGMVMSFGMKQFGLPDAMVEDDGEDFAGAWVLFEFNIHLWAQNPSLKDGHTFSRAEKGAPWYRLQHVSDKRYPEAHPYFNPHGVWVLTFA